MELQLIKTNTENQVTVYTARFGFNDLLEMCREKKTLDKATMNEPHIVDSRLNHTLDGSIEDLTIVVFPLQYTLDMISLVDARCTEEDRATVLCRVSKRGYKAALNDLLGYRIVFVPMDLMKQLQGTLKQRVKSKENPLYASMCAQMRGDAVPEADRECLSRLVTRCGSIKELSRVLKPKRGSVTGHIPRRVIYISP